MQANAMRAMILAAGRGERLRPLTDKTPKPLLNAGGAPLIVWHLKRLFQAGFRDVVINHAWLGDKIEAALGDGRKFGLRIHYSPESTALETAGGIATALPLLGEVPFLVVNADVLTDIDFAAARTRAERLRAHGDWAHLWLVANPPHHVTGDFSCTAAGRVPRRNTDATWTYSGVGVYAPEIFRHTPAQTCAKLAPLLHEAQRQGKLSAAIHRGLWLDVGTPERLQEAMRWRAPAVRPFLHEGFQAA